MIQKGNRAALIDNAQSVKMSLPGWLVTSDLEAIVMLSTEGFAGNMLKRIKEIVELTSLRDCERLMI